MQNVAEWLTAAGLPALGERWRTLGITGTELQGLIHLRGQRALKQTLQVELGVSDPRTLLTVTGHLMALFRVV